MGWRVPNHERSRLPIRPSRRAAHRWIVREAGRTTVSAWEEALGVCDTLGRDVRSTLLREGKSRSTVRAYSASPNWFNVDA